MHQQMSCQSSQRDRRAHTRQPVDLFVNRFLNGYPYLCRATDISRSGMRLMPLLEPTDGKPRFMGLQFQLPGSRTVITASGEAVCDEGGDPKGAVGVRFTRLTSDSMAVIDQFLSGAATSSSASTVR